MQDARVRNTILVLVAVLVASTGGILYGKRQSQPAVTITGAQPSTPDPVVSPLPPSNDAGPATTVTTADSSSSDPVAQTVASTKSTSNLIYVHVAGAVKHPDLYQLPEGSRVAGAIKAAGGPAADADIDAINLAEKVVDGEKIYIPRKGESGTTTTQPGNTIGYQSTTPMDTPSTTSTETVESSSHSHSSSRGGHSSNKLTDPSQGKVNINTASAEELERLPGVGPATAARIIAYRQQSGGFKKPEDLMEVGGIGDKKMAKLAPFVTVR